MTGPPFLKGLILNHYVCIIALRNFCTKNVNDLFLFFAYSKFWFNFSTEILNLSDNDALKNGVDHWFFTHSKFFRRKTWTKIIV